MPVLIRDAMIDSDDAVAVGLIPHWSNRSVRGRNQDVDTASGETVWTVGGIYVYPTSSSILSTVSSSLQDSAGGTGARSILFQGLTSDFTETSEIVIMNGLTPVSTVNSYYRMRTAFVLTSGSTTTNVGNITISHGANPIGRIGIDAITGWGVGRTADAVFTCPKNKTVLINKFFLNIGGSNTATATGFLFIRPLGGSFSHRLTMHAIANGSSYVERDSNAPITMDTGDDAEVRVVVSANNIDIIAGFDLSLHDV